MQPMRDTVAVIAVVTEASTGAGPAPAGHLDVPSHTTIVAVPEPAVRTGGHGA